MEICHLRDIFNTSDITAMDNYGSYLVFSQTELLKQALFLSNRQCLMTAIRETSASSVFLITSDTLATTTHISQACQKLWPKLYQEYSHLIHHTAKKQVIRKTHFVSLDWEKMRELKQKAWADIMWHLRT